MTPIQAGKFDRISHEEHRLVVENPVLITLFGLELDSPSTEVSDCISGATLGAHSGYASEEFGALANRAGKESGRG